MSEKERKVSLGPISFSAALSRGAIESLSVCPLGFQHLVSPLAHAAVFRSPFPLAPSSSSSPPPRRGEHFQARFTRPWETTDGESSGQRLSPIRTLSFRVFVAHSRGNVHEVDECRIRCPSNCVATSNLYRAGSLSRHR